MARQYLDEIFNSVKIAEVEKFLRSGRLGAFYTDFRKKASETENPYRPGNFGSRNANFLSRSIKFDKSLKSPDPVISRTAQVGMYLTPAGKFGTCDACRHKTQACGAACLHDAGFQDVGTQIARTKAIEENPVESAAAIYSELQSHVIKSEREGFLPSARLDATSEIAPYQHEIGDLLYGGMGGEWQQKHTDGPFKGLHRLVGSEYAKEHAKGVLLGAEPEIRQPNVRVVPSWSDQTTKARGEQLMSRGRDLAVPTTAFGTSGHPKPAPTHMAVQFKGGDLIMPVVDYDEHDVIGLREQTGSAGLLRAKSPGFRKREPETQQIALRFLRPQRGATEEEIKNLSPQTDAPAERWIAPTPVSVRPSRRQAFGA